MNHFYAHAEAGEPTARLNDHHPADPFAVVDLGGDLYFTSKDPQWCRRVAASWTLAAELLEQATERDRGRAAIDEARTDGACTASVTQGGSTTLRGSGRFVGCEEGSPS